MKSDNESRQRIQKIRDDKIAGANVQVAKILLVFAALSFILFIIFQLHLLNAARVLVNHTLLVIPVFFVIFAVWCLRKKGQGKAFEYIFFSLLTLFWLGLELMTGYKCKMLLPVLLLLSLRYYNRKFTVFTYIVSAIVLLLSVWCSAYLYTQTGLLDLNTVEISGSQSLVVSGNLSNEIIALQPDSWKLFADSLILSFIPNLIFLSFNAYIALQFMKYNLLNILQTEEAAEKEADMRLELNDMRTKVMLSQIKPHFLFNTLTAIAALCTRDAAKAKKLTLDFSVYLRNNLSAIDPGAPTICSFETELDHIKTYLNIEKVRFGDKLHVEYDIQEFAFSVPVMSIQPIVENAVKHGIFQKSGGGTVTISTTKTEGGYLVTVTDDGIGFNLDEIGSDGKEHVGIANIKKRLDSFGSNVKIDSTPGIGTTVTAFIKEMEM